MMSECLRRDLETEFLDLQVAASFDVSPGKEKSSDQFLGDFIAHTGLKLMVEIFKTIKPPES